MRATWPWLFFSTSINRMASPWSWGDSLYHPPPIRQLRGGGACIDVNFYHFPNISVSHSRFCGPQLAFSFSLQTRRTVALKTPNLPASSRQFPSCPICSDRVVECGIKRSFSLTTVRKLQFGLARILSGFINRACEGLLA